MVQTVFLMNLIARIAVYTALPAACLLVLIVVQGAVVSRYLFTSDAIRIAS